MDQDATRPVPTRQVATAMAQILRGALHRSLLECACFGGTGAGVVCVVVADPLHATRALTKSLQEGHRCVGSFWRARLTASRSSAGIMVRSGGRSMWPRMTSPGGPRKGNRPPRSSQYVTPREY